MKGKKAEKRKKTPPQKQGKKAADCDSSARRIQPHSAACQPPRSPASLQKQEQISGPKNAAIARFDGLGCYQIRSETSKICKTQAAAKTG